MRPHQLKMKAFGPFSKETIVDFDAMGNSIFLISGDTGAGKTTIFDGMIYALYGTASGGSRSSLSTEALHSDYCKDGQFKEEMRVEFTFSNAGRTLTASRRMYWGKNGETQKAIKESTLSENGHTLVHSKGREDKDEVTEKIKEFLGLDADQFRRIIMLAQGEFQKFLTSDSEDRGKILGKLFDNRRHLDLQLRLKAANRMLENREKELTAEARAQLGMFYLPESADEETCETVTVDHPLLLKTMEEILSQLSCEGNKLNTKISDINQQVIKLNSRKTLGETQNRQLDLLDRKNRELQGLQNRESEFSAKKQLLEPAKSARLLLPMEDARRNAANNLQRLENNMALLQEEQKRLEESLVLLKQEAERTEKSHLPQIEELRKSGSELEGILRLYDELVLAEKERDEKEKALTNAQTRVSRAEQERNRIKSSLDQVNRQLSDLENAGEMAVTEANRRLEEQKKRNATIRELMDRIKEINLLKKSVQDLKKQSEDAELEAHRAEGKHFRLNEAFLSGQAGLLAQEMRQELLTKPEVFCPVCGTKHTPEDISHLALCREDVPTKEQVDGAFREWSAVREKGELLNKQFTEKKAEFDNGLKGVLEKSQELLGISDLAELRKGELLLRAVNSGKESFVKLQREYRIACEQKEARGKAIQEKNRLEDSMEKAAEESTQAAAGLQQAGVEHSEARTRAEEKRKGLQGYPVTQKEALLRISLLKQKADALQKQVEQSRQSYLDCQNRMENVSGRLASAKTEKVSAEEAVGDTGAAFAEGLLRYDFDDENAYQRARSPEGWLLDRDALEEWIRLTEHEIDRYEQTRRELAAEIRQLRLATEGVERIDLKALEEQILSLQGELRQMTEEDKKLTSRLQTNRSVYEKLCRIRKQQEKYARAFRKLNPLAETANGNYAFSRFVLGDFFHRIIEQANVHLETMTDGEYCLVPKETGDGRKKIGLDLRILNTITGLERETASLSGGQLFEASLSLALGLSDVVQMESTGTIQIDSMFIDEGFGSLDGARLDKAIEVLQHLSAGKRQIGIISHVARLDECLPKKIHVIAGNRGSTVRIESDE